MTADTEFLRRREAAKYLSSKYGCCTERTLAKLASVGGGPLFRKVGRLVFYARPDLDNWMLERMSAPMRSTSDCRSA